MSNSVVQLDTRYTQDVIPILDTSKFEHMQRIATAMAECSTIPDSFRYVGGKPEKGELPRSTVVANCFRVVNQAVRWGFDPFAVMDCASIVHGKLMWEGKLVAAVIDAKLSIRLAYNFDEQPGQLLGVVVSGTLPGEGTPRTIEGNVKQWHKGEKSPWANPPDWKRQLRYRGAREWARAHAPAIMLGIYADDELRELASLDIPTGQRAQRMKDITPAKAALAQDIPEVPDIPDIPEPTPIADTAPVDTDDEADFLAMLRDALDGVRNAKARQKTWDDFSDDIERLSDAGQRAAEAIFEGREKAEPTP